MKKLLSLLLALLLLCFAGTTFAEEDPNLGIYTAKTAEYSGFSLSVDTFFEEGFIIELKEKGKCTLTIDGTSANGKWTLDGTAFTVKGGGLDCSGTLAYGVMRIEYEGVTFVLVNENYAGPTAVPEPVETPEPVATPTPEPIVVPVEAPTETSDPLAGLSGENPLAVLDGGLMFMNQTGATIHNVYISNDPEEWGDSLLEKDVFLPAGEHFLFTFEDLDGEPGVYDVGVIDENRLNYDFFDVMLSEGDILALPPAQDDGTATLVVVHSGGASDFYTGKSYLSEGGTEAAAEAPADGSATEASADATALLGAWAHGSYVYEFKENGVGVYHLGTSDMDFTYTVSETEISFLYTGNTSPLVLKYKLSDSKLTITDSFGSDVIYIKQ